LTSALNDSYFGLRIMTLENIDLSNPKKAKKAIKIVEDLAKNDPKTLVQAKAVKVLGNLNDKKYLSLFNDALKSTSFSVQSNAISALYNIDKIGALKAAKSIPAESKKYMNANLVSLFIKEKDESEMAFIATNLIAGMFFNPDKDVQTEYGKAFEWIAASSNVEATQVMIDSFVKTGLQFKSYGADKMMLQLMQKVIDLKTKAHLANETALLAIVNEGINKLK